MSTIFELFKEAGYANLADMEIDRGYTPKKELEVYTVSDDFHKKEWHKVNLLFYKGMSKPNDSYQILVPSKTKSFLCTGSHLLLCAKTRQYYSIDQINTLMDGKFYALGDDMYEVLVEVQPTYETFPILDIEVDNVSCYFTGGIVSHNSFGGSALLFSEGLKKINPYLSRNKTSLCMIRQVRKKMGFIGHGYDNEASGGGMAPQFYASWRARVARGEDILDVKTPIGNVIKAKNIKNKVGYPKRSADMNLLYGSGFNPDEEYLDFIIDLGIVKKAGAWFSNEDWKLKCQGRDNLLDFLLDNKPIFESVKTIVMDSFTKHTVLDEQEAPLDAEEAEENKGDPEMVGEE